MEANSSISQSDEFDNYCYIPHVDFIRKLRDSYKEGTQNTFKRIKTEVENEGEERIHQAEKVQTLLGDSRRTLHQLYEQRKSIGRTLVQHDQQTKLLCKQIRQEKNERLQALQENESAMYQLLNELKSRET